MKKDFNIPPDLAPGPWRFTQGGSPGWRVTDNDNNLVCFSKDNPYTAPNAEFIIWCRNHIEELVKENSIYRTQEERLRKQTTKIREIYQVLEEIKTWLIETEQPDTYIREFEKLVNESGIFRESEV